MIVALAVNLASFSAFMSWVWSFHDQVGLFLTFVVFLWVGASKQKKEAIGKALPRFAHLLNLFAAIGVNVIDAKREFALFKAGAPYQRTPTLPPLPPPAEPAVKSDENDG